jgi:hypothetical protein
MSSHIASMRRIFSSIGRTFTSIAVTELKLCRVKQNAISLFPRYPIKAESSFKSVTLTSTGNSFEHAFNPPELAPVPVPAARWSCSKCPFNSSSRSIRRAHRTRFQPLSQNQRAVAWPIPELAPVRRAVGLDDESN